MKDNVQSGATTKLPLVAKVQLGAYGLFLITTAAGLFGLALAGLSRLDERLKWLDFTVFNRLVSVVICDLGTASYLCQIVFFLIFRKSFEQHAPQITEYLKNSTKKCANRCRNPL